MSAHRSTLLALAFLLFCCTAHAAAPVDEFLRDGRIRDGLAAYAAPASNAERFSLALLQALDGLQQFGTGCSRLGLNPEIARTGLPFLRVVVPNQQFSTNTVATPEGVAALFLNLQAALRRANQTLAPIDAAPFTVEVNLSRTRIDFDGDGTVASNEWLLASLGRSFRLPMNQQPGTPDLIIHFDSADAVWLKGYTHFLMGLLDVFTAYDWTPTWNQCAHIVFCNPLPKPPIARYSPHQGKNSNRDMSSAADMIAALHETRLEPVHKDGLLKARENFRQMIACSRLCWQRVLAETDNDHEWLPGPLQTGPAGAKVTAQQVEGWQLVLDELDAVLTGQSLLPHWRFRSGMGINVDKLVNTPPRFDPVLIIQGSALIPYLEEGTVSDKARWRTLLQPFGPGFTLFALWSN
jgi:hypothetical protein